MRIALLILCFGLLLLSCGSKNAVPRNVLSQKEMKEVMWDMMRADQFLTDYVFSRDSSVSRYLESTKWYGQILAIHNISQEKFRNSFNYYNEHPEQMKVLMDSIAVYPDTSGLRKAPSVTDSSRKITAPIAQ
jgi:hypothetical protein